MEYRAFLFDLDGVITSSSREHFDAWRAIVEELGFGLADEIEELTKGISRRDSLEVISKRNERSELVHSVGIVPRLSPPVRPLIRMSAGKVWFHTPRLCRGMGAA